MDHPLRALLDAAARGRFPPPDGAVEVFGPPPGKADAIVGFTGHHVVAAPLPEAEVCALLPSGSLLGPLRPDVVAAIARRLLARPGSIDVVLAVSSADPVVEVTLRPDDGLGLHTRVQRAQRYRSDVRAFRDDEGRAVLILGRGLAGRWEVSLEVDAAHRGGGLGAAVLRAAPALADGEPLFAQVAPGNAASLRAFIAAGFAPIGAEVLFPRRNA